MKIFFETSPDMLALLDKDGKVLDSNTHFAENAGFKKNEVLGKIAPIEFVVEKDGSLTDIKVAKGIGGGCDDEAVRVISQAPKWNPGKQRGNAVRVRMVLPIIFKLLT